MRKRKRSRVGRHFDFHIALSFAGEDREYVSCVADMLKKMGLRVFYDKHETATMWGKDLYAYLREIYFERAMYTVLFISKHYAQKLWTNHERDSAQARAFQENQEYILPARFDSSKVPGLLPTTCYVDLRDFTPEELAQLVKEKLGPVPRVNFFPDEPDVLFEELGLVDLLARDETLACAYHVRDALSLMTLPERKLLNIAALHCCPTGLPNDIHINLEYLARLSGYASDEIIRIVSRLDCLGIKSRIFEKEDEPAPKGVVISSKKIIELTYEVIATDFCGNAINVLEAIFRIIAARLCPDCAENAVDVLDFSVLGSLTGFADGE